MPTVIEVAFRRRGKTYSFNPGNLTLAVGDQVILKTTQGMEIGEITSNAREVEEEKVKRPLKKVVRKANVEDLERAARNSVREDEAFHVGEEKIAEHKLPMKLVRVEQIFDGSKMAFYFTAENRVDFRELVKDLASHFKTRIELRQIGVRDKARMIGGMGICGKDLCCTMFLSDLNPISIRMAKEQFLPLNPQKISGVCGRLMCCLRYEFEAYKDFRKRAPKRGACIETCNGHKGCVLDMNAVKERVRIQEDETGKRFEVDIKDITKTVNPKKGARRKDTRETKETQAKKEIKEVKDQAAPEDKVEIKEMLAEDEATSEESKE